MPVQCASSEAPPSAGHNNRRRFHCGPERTWPSSTNVRLKESGLRSQCPRKSILKWYESMWNPVYKVLSTCLDSYVLKYMKVLKFSKIFHQFPSQKQIRGRSQHGQLARATRSTPQERKHLAGLAGSGELRLYSANLMSFYGTLTLSYVSTENGIGMMAMPASIRRQHGREPRTSDGISKRLSIRRCHLTTFFNDRHGGSTTKLPNSSIYIWAIAPLFEHP